MLIGCIVERACVHAEAGVRVEAGVHACDSMFLRGCSFC